MTPRLGTPVLAYETCNLKDINDHYNEVQMTNQNAILNEFSSGVKNNTHYYFSRGDSICHDTGCVQRRSGVRIRLVEGLPLRPNARGEPGLVQDDGGDE